MAIVSNALPFNLNFITPYFGTGRICADTFSSTESAIWEKEIVSASVEENTEISIEFFSEDPDAKLYLECFDIIPGAEGLDKDANGLFYRKSSEESFYLFKIGEKYDELCVDMFALKVWCYGKWYYGSLQITPKQLSIQEWNMMRDDLEREARGLAKNMIRKRIGSYSFTSEDDLQLLRDFLILQKSAKKLNSVISDISQNPRYEVCTRYRYERADISVSSPDYKALREIMRKGNSTDKIPVAEKYLEYDTQENRILKMMLTLFENRLRQFIQFVPAEKFFANGLGQRLLAFRDDARKLVKMFTALKQEEWYKTVKPISSNIIPQNFLFDVRFSFIYKIYNRMHDEDEMFQEMLVSAKWKRSSYLYEMWCYFKVLHILSEKMGFSNVDTNMLLLSQVGRLDLQKEAVAEMENDDIRLKVIYDSKLPSNALDTDIENPLYIAKSFNAEHNHDRPDIVINAYDKKNGWYIGSIVLECKYRRITSFLSDDPSKSSLSQLQMYTNNARSSFLYGGMADNFIMSPVRKVIVFSPDRRARGEMDSDFRVFAQTLRPSDNDEISHSIRKILEKEIDVMSKNSMMIRNMFAGQSEGNGLDFSGGAEAECI